MNQYIILIDVLVTFFFIFDLNIIMLSSYNPPSFSTHKNLHQLSAHSNRCERCKLDQTNLKTECAPPLDVTSCGLSSLFRRLIFTSSPLLTHKGVTVRSLTLKLLIGRTRSNLAKQFLHVQVSRSITLQDNRLSLLFNDERLEFETE